MNVIQDELSTMLSDYNTATDSWIHHNCPACTSFGQPRPDTRGRGNHMYTSTGGLVYNCYNCSASAVWELGSNLSNKMKIILSSFGVSDRDILRLDFLIKEINREGNFSTEYQSSKIHRSVQIYDLPENTKSFSELVLSNNVSPSFVDVVNKIGERNPYLLDLDLYWCPSKEHYLYNKFILPYYMNNEIVGFTARDKVKNTKFRYYNQVSINTFYNFDLINDPRIKNLFVLEGALDAALMGGVSINNFSMSTDQISVLKQAKENGKNIIIVPDRDKDGRNTIQQALDNGFYVSLPDFGTVRENGTIRYVKDCEEATSKYGRLFTLELLYQNIHKSKFEIEFNGNKWI